MASTASVKRSSATDRDSNGRRKKSTTAASDVLSDSSTKVWKGVLSLRSVTIPYQLLDQVTSDEEVVHISKTFCHNFSDLVKSYSIEKCPDSDSESDVWLTQLTRARDDLARCLASEKKAKPEILKGLVAQAYSRLEDIPSEEPTEKPLPLPPTSKPPSISDNTLFGSSTVTLVESAIACQRSRSTASLITASITSSARTQANVVLRLLKKCTSPSCSDLGFDPDGSWFSGSITERVALNAADIVLDGNGRLKTATINALLRVVTSSEGVADPQIVPAFFLGFRFFMSPKALVQALRSLTPGLPPENLPKEDLDDWYQNALLQRSRVRKTLSHWLEKYWYPDQDSVALDDIRNFISVHGVTWPPKTLQNAKRLVEKIAKGEWSRKHYVEEQHAKYLAGTRLVLETKFSLGSQLGRLKAAKWDKVTLIAQELTMIEYEAFRPIEPDSMAISRIGKTENTRAADKLQVFRDLECTVCLFVTSSVLEEKTKEDRDCVTEFWLQMAKECLRLNNFSGAYAIMSGLGNNAVRRLDDRKTLFDKGAFKELDGFFSWDKNYLNYHTALKKAMEDHVPFLPLLAILTRNMEGSVGIIREGKAEQAKVNLRQLFVIHKAVTVLEAALLPYQFPRHENVKTFLEYSFERFPASEEKQLQSEFYKLSTSIQPKRVVRFQESVKKVITSSKQAKSIAPG